MIIVGSYLQLPTGTTPWPLLSDRISNTVHMSTLNLFFFSQPRQIFLSPSVPILVRLVLQACDHPCQCLLHLLCSGHIPFEETPPEPCTIVQVWPDQCSASLLHIIFRCLPTSFLWVPIHYFLFTSVCFVVNRL